MCLVAFAINTSARWPLVIASNRDESFERPSLPLARWQNAAGHTIISGRDVRAGGTWLGMTPGGRIALLTNVRELPASSQAPAPKSRGELVMRWLESDMDADQFMAQTDSTAYAGFNLVVGDWSTNSWTWLGNRSFDRKLAGSAAHRPQGSGWCSRALAPGVYGLSNAALDTPWPKTLALKKALAGAMADAAHAPDPDAMEATLWTALASRRRAGPGELPDTGLPMALEEALSSAFVDSPERAYGTRCSTLLVASATENLQDAGRWTVRMQEKTHHQPVKGQSAHGPSDSMVSQVLHWQRAGVVL
ncbi:MAG: NRDE family protein [Pseudomonadota bacterium]